MSDSRSDRPRILFILHLPPPVHGASMMGQQIRDSKSLSSFCKAHFINLSASSTLSEIGRKPWKKALLVFRLLRLVRQGVRDFKPDLVYVTPTSKLPGFIKDYLVVRLVRKAGIRVVVHFHNKGVSTRQEGRLDDWLYRRFFQDTDVILLSRLLYPDVSKYVREDRVHICPNGIPGLVANKEKHAGFRFLFLSNLIPSKGVLVLLDACRILKDKGRDMVCEFVGADSAEMDGVQFLKEIHKRQLDGVVTYSGPLYGHEKEQSIARSDAFVFPTFYPNECFPLVLLEALSMALPIISTREGAIPDIVEDGVNGFLCPKQDPSALADAMEYLLDHPEEAHEMGIRGREFFDQKFTSGHFEANLLGILEKLVS